jgi:hypothetical protein
VQKWETYKQETSQEQKEIRQAVETDWQIVITLTPQK